MAMAAGGVNLPRRRNAGPIHGQLAFDPETLLMAVTCRVPAERGAPGTTLAPRPRGAAQSEPVAPGIGYPDVVWPNPTPAPSPGDPQRSEAMSSVGRFHQAFGLPRSSRPTADIPAELANLRVDLLVEEVEEFASATTAQDIVGIADALADIVYVAYGAALTYGIDLDAVLREVHRSNMSKLDEQGKPIYRADGKVLKSSRYTPPDIPRVLLFQPPLPF